MTQNEVLAYVNSQSGKINPAVLGSLLGQLTEGSYAAQVGSASFSAADLSQSKQLSFDNNVSNIVLYKTDTQLYSGATSINGTIISVDKNKGISGKFGTSGVQAFSSGIQIPNPTNKVSIPGTFMNLGFYGNYNYIAW